jgi:Family of unknown function (DUF6152)
MAALIMRGLVVALIVLTAIVGNGPALVAHHSQSAYTDASGAISITGVVKKVEFTNPHAFIYLEVTEEGGKTRVWALELMSIRALKMLGWLSDTVKVGDTITAIGRPAKSGAPAMYSEAIKLADGRMMRS